MSDGYRQEVFNVLLAQLLQERGVIAAPENVLRLPERGPARRMPDVLVEFHGLRTVIEGEVSDQPEARDRALNSARRRVEEGIAYIGIGVVYPAELRQADYAALKGELARSELDIAIITEAGESGFVHGDLNQLERTLREAYNRLLQEDVVAEAVAALDAGVENFAGAVESKKGTIGKLALALDERANPDNLSHKQVGAVARISGLVLANAMIFQEMLTTHYSRVKALDIALENPVPSSEFSQQWRYILDKIAYYPIFHLAHECITSLSADPDAAKALRALAQTARRIVSLRAALRHDLMGRVYHRLLAEAKYLGAYYTSIPSAALLLKLALSGNDGAMQWDDLDSVARFKVADLACGTGTLLIAAAESIMDNYISASAQQNKPVNLKDLQTALAEQILHGYDVLPSAIHLTASTLALRAPEVAFKKMNLFSMPLGGPYHKLGSLEFLKGMFVPIPMDLFGAISATQVTGKKTEKRSDVSAILPELDLCVMNPPFVRSVGGNLLFGSVPEAEREVMQSDLQKLIRHSKVPANVTAGLGSVFIATADPYIKVGGRIALILPKALLSGVAWGVSRDLLNRRYRLEYLIVSHDAERWNFSDSTDLSEVMLVAKKIGATPPEETVFQVKDDGRKSYGDDEPRVIAINLWRYPPTSFEALAIAFDTLRHSAPDLLDGQGAHEYTVGNEKYGEAIAFPWRLLKQRSDWMLPCAFAQSDLIRAAYHLAAGKLWLPGQKARKKVPLIPLGELGTLGPDVRDLADGFKVSHSKTAYAAFWGHESDAVYTLAQKPNQHLLPLPKALLGRPLRKTEDLWPLAGKVLLAERLRLNSQRLVAVRLSESVLSNSWWELTFKKGLATAQREKALTLWLNSTLGLFLLILHRQETEGAWVKFKKPTLAALPVLDLTALTPAQLRKLASAYDKLSTQALLPLPQMNEDSTRIRIDAAITDALNLPDFSILRQMLAREPVVCIKRI